MPCCFPLSSERVSTDFRCPQVDAASVFPCLDRRKRRYGGQNAQFVGGGFGTLIRKRIKHPGSRADVPVRWQRSKVPKDRGSIAKLDALGQSLPYAADLAKKHGDRPASDLLTGVSREIDRSL